MQGAGDSNFAGLQVITIRILRLERWTSVGGGEMLSEKKYPRKCDERISWTFNTEVYGKMNGKDEEEKHKKPEI